jgi:hypothetical protein
MTEYNITIEIEGYESGLIETAVEDMFEPCAPQSDGVSVTATPVESDTTQNPNITVERNKYVNVFSDDRLIVSLSEEDDEVLLYQFGTDEPLVSYSLSELENGEALPSR